jgi:hypothetical protein
MAPATSLWRLAIWHRGQPQLAPSSMNEPGGHLAQRFLYFLPEPQGQFWLPLSREGAFGTLTGSGRRRMLVFSEAAQFFLTESDFLSLRASRKTCVVSQFSRPATGRKEKCPSKIATTVGVNLRSILPTVASPSYPCLRMRGPTAAETAALQNKTPSVPGWALSSNRTLDF